jgi:hypothetical protein
MNGRFFLLAGILLAAALILPAGAFTAKDLTVTVLKSGDARVDFRYELNWLEQFAVFARIADPGAELKSALEKNSGKTVEILRTDTTGTSFVINQFATVAPTEQGTRYTTPALSFQEAQRVLNEYWFAPLISPDFSPEVTTIVFPDGQQEVFDNALNIPSVGKTVAT